MVHYGVPADLLEFRDEFFPQPTPASTTRPKPNLTLDAAAVNVHGLAPGLKMSECGERPDPATINPESRKIDAAFYNVDDVPDDGRQRWADQILSLEFKRDDVSLDPFDEEEENICSTPTLTPNAQHVALFTLVVLGTRIRFVRWDRSGTVVTRAFDYVQKWNVSCEILWRIGNCTMTQLGFDPSATRLYPGQAEYNLMDTAADNVEGDVVGTEHVVSGSKLPDGHFKYIMKKESYILRSLLDPALKGQARAPDLEMRELAPKVHIDKNEEFAEDNNPVLRFRPTLPRSRTPAAWTYPALFTIFREEGPAALYKGFVPKVLRLAPGGGVLLTEDVKRVNSTTSKLLVRHTSELAPDLSVSDISTTTPLCC
ncbi:hypothetical protein DICSQDRAFT_172690 [Dichomitus squalens LYAD-421 SS1]|uniref:Fungal-type protein kinase domain-containing protein n=1 Tax=Dichomitus squalens (strain LYAD-421) TaxID=732165 RepID=R7SRA2_DICSQ|nr:uncharacterized protein DICSQDRAFT_172690 [Dichomitus squalens LYAD-421 SS1]EJF58679.1 hypothetical protein DICSQDRAFT_172690 [Dichomitus squalens LYAD-421 SS1]